MQVEDAASARPRWACRQTNRPESAVRHDTFSGNLSIRRALVRSTFDARANDLESTSHEMQLLNTPQSSFTPGVVQMVSERLGDVVRPAATAGKPDAVPLDTRTQPKKDRRHVDWHGHVQSLPESVF